jgi:hypothetical protein
MNTEINTIAFSKNRACQLELLLRSLNMPVTVLYSYDPEFKAGYDKLIGMYPSVTFVLRYDFKKQLLEILDKSSEFILFLVDDDIMLDPFYENCHEFVEFKNNPDIICLSLRMTPSYRHNGFPVLENNKWEWKLYRRGGKGYNHRLRNWGYPMSVGSHIFRKKDIVPIILANEMKNPNYLEGALDANIPNRPLMLCFDKAKIINNIVNQVQTDFPSHIVGISAKELEEKFLKGERISIQDIKEKASKARDCYLKTDYKFIKETGITI